MVLSVYIVTLKPEALFAIFLGVNSVLIIVLSIPPTAV